MTQTTLGADASGIAAEVAAFAPAFIDHVNGAYPDVVQLLATAHTGLPDVSGAAVTGLHVGGVTLTVPTPAGSRQVDVPFTRPVAELGELHERAIEVAIAARQQLGIAEPTSAEVEARAMDAIPTHVTSVVRVEQLTPRCRQITFGGGDLDEFRPGGLDSFIYVLLPPPGRTELTIDSGFSWSQYEEMPEDERPVGAYYTLRRWRPPADGRPAELDMIFVLHDSGHATTWAARAEPGDPVALWGPRTAYQPPADTDWLLLAADETGLPAVSVILENNPAGLPAEVFIEVDGPAEQLPLPESPDTTVRWLHRDGAPAGTTTLLADAVAAFPLRPGNVYAWGGAESRVMTAIRKDLRRGRGIDQPRVTMVGYWRHASTTESDIAADDDID